MRKGGLIILAAALGCFFFLLIKRGKPAESQVIPEVLDIRPSQAMIVWLSEDSYKGRVFYWSMGNEQMPMSAEENFGASRQHEVLLTGLRPATRYTYQIDGSQSRFQFQTSPPANTPFSFLVVWNGVSDRIVSLVRSEFAEFIVSLSDLSRWEKDIFSEVRPYVPVYTMTGVDSPFLRQSDSQRKKDVSAGYWSLDWGGLRLIFTDASFNADSLGDLLNAPAAHTLGLVTFSEGIGPMEAETISQSPLHTQLTIHNSRYPANAVAFVAVVTEETADLEIDGIKYFGIGGTVKDQDAGVMRIDIDVDSARAVFVDANREVVLKEPPLGQKLTCEDCRRLADKGAYEASVAAYRAFIDANKGHFQIDDAYYAIADIYDFKLFEFEKALFWYWQLINEYPNGTLVPLANQRIRHITAYADYKYEPLTRFERIRAVEYARKKGHPQERDKVLGEVKQLIKEYPDSNLAPVMQLWLANQYRMFAPDEAVQAYLALRNNYPGRSEAQEVMFEIGATYYDAGRYREAIKIFRQALNELPALADTIHAQIVRAERNIRRDRIAYLCWAVIMGLGAAAVLIKPRWIGTSGVIQCVIVLIVMMTLLYAGAWLIREQFNSVREMHSIVLSFSAAAGVSHFIAINFTHKLMSRSDKKRWAFASIAATSAALVFFLAGIYVALYCFYVHYLVILRL